MPRLLLPLALLLAAAAGPPADAGVLASATWVERVAGVPFSVPLFATGTSTATSVSVSLQIPRFELTTYAPATLPATLPTPKVVLRGPGGSAKVSATPGVATGRRGFPHSAWCSRSTPST